MTIALFSDIHANLPALEAFFASVDEQKPDAIYCLGDLVGYNIWPNEVINEIRLRRIPTIAGNYDFGVGRTSEDCGCAYRTEEEKANGAVSISYTNQVVQNDERAYLRTLPAHIRVEFQLKQDKLNLLLVHGSPRRVNEYLFEDREEKSLLRIMQDADADIMCFGHTHKPYHRVLPSIPSPRPIIAMRLISARWVSRKIAIRAVVMSCFMLTITVLRWTKTAFGWILCGLNMMSKKPPKPSKVAPCLKPSQMLYAWPGKTYSLS
jgi:predicted phosphodiesterase